MADCARLLRRVAERSSSLGVAAGLFLVVLAIYILTSPGRIDIIDGQARYDVSYNWLMEGRPVLRDPWIGSFVGVRGREGLRYSYYGAPASVFAMPLIWLAHFTDTPAQEVSRFAFSLTSSFFGAALASLLFLFYVDLGVSQRKAALWTMVSSFATQIWPASNSTFDNAQHAFFVIASVYLAFLSAKHNSRILAAGSGAFAAVLILYQEYFLLLVPAVAIAALRWDPTNERSFDEPLRSRNQSWYSRFIAGVRCTLQDLCEFVRGAFREPGHARESCVRFLLSAGIALAAGVALSLVYNNLRFGSFLDNGKLRAQAEGFPLFGNPLAGLGTLLCSPGKSIFLYSPTLALALWGIGRLRRTQPALVLTVIAASVVLVSFISCIVFVGGDWCWGPRYLVPLLPLWALALPFLPGRIRRDVVLSVVGAGLLVQVLALSVENQRFFFERSLPPYFWAADPWFYFKHSALFARVGETISLNQGLPSSAQFFNSIPITDWCTYTILGPPGNVPPSLVPKWMLHFKIYYLPRPWPLWMSWIKPAMRPIDLRLWVCTLLGIAGMGAGVVFRGLHLGINKRTSPDIVADREMVLK